MFDVTLRGGTVHDGLGSPGRVADVAVDSGRVVAVGRDLGPARRELDVTGLVVAPGFIDPHSHSDMVPFLEAPQPFKLLQGVTTEVNGNCGFSFAPLPPAALPDARTLLAELAGSRELSSWTFTEYLDAVETAGPTNHVATLVGHGTLRMAAAGMAEELTPAQREHMARLASESFEAGALGLSSGLIYPPGAYSDIEELVELAKVVHAYGRLYTTHLRDEGEDLAGALDEAIEIARRTRVRLQVSHCKAAGRPSYGKSTMLLDKLHAARVTGVDVRGDQYPYLAGSTMLVALLPPEALVGGVDALRERITDPDQRARLRAVAEDPKRTSGVGVWRQATPADVLITHHARAGVPGRTLAAVAGERDPWDVLAELLVEDPSAMMVVTLMSEDDVQRIMADPLISVGSDNGIPVGLEHPRTWGCFPRFLGTYVRELGVVDLAEAVRKMTSATATQFGLTGRGWIGPGAIADLCVFDLGTVGHAGTYAEPAITPTGIRYVLLAGSVAVDDGEFTGQRLGQVLRAGREP